MGGPLNTGSNHDESKRRPQQTYAIEELPNVGTAIAADLRQLGVKRPLDLVGRDPYQLFEQLCTRTGHRHDPCVLDTFIAAVRYMEGGPKTPWWKFTPERKRTLAKQAAIAAQESKPKRKASN